MFSKGYNPGGVRKKTLDLESAVASLQANTLKQISLSSIPTPTTAGTKNNMGKASDGYLYIWLNTSVVVRVPCETSW